MIPCSGRAIPSEGNGCTFRDIHEVSGRTTISVELEWVKEWAPPGLPGTVPGGTGLGCRLVSSRRRGCTLVHPFYIAARTRHAQTVRPRS